MSRRLWDIQRATPRDRCSTEQISLEDSSVPIMLPESPDRLACAERGVGRVLSAISHNILSTKYDNSEQNP